VTKHLPALLRAAKLQKKAAKTGFEWPDTQGFIDKTIEELHELKQAVAEESTLEIEDELGDVLFCYVNFARHKGINAEEALRKANDKFASRFKKMETILKDKNKVISEASLDEMLQYWCEAKKH